MGARGQVPEGTVIVAGTDQFHGAEEDFFHGFPEAYDDFEYVFVPEEDRRSHMYAGGYVITFRAANVGDLLEPIEPLDPRPETDVLFPPLKRLQEPE